MTPVFMFSVFFSTDDTRVSSVEQNTENMKIGVIGGAEYRKHKKLVSSVE
jgi:hypothetical protein